MSRAILALDIGGTKIAAAAVSLAAPATEDGEATEAVTQLGSVATEAHRGGEHVLATVTDLAARCLSRCRANRRDITAVGVASAGVIDPGDASVRYASELMPGWTGMPLGRRLRERTGLPVTVLNDVHAHGLGEAGAGAGAPFGRVLAVAAGTGLGGALVQNGRVDTGSAGVAGSIAHLPHPLARGLTCACGSRSGHIETIASGSGQAALYNRDLPADIEPAPSGGEVYQRSLEGERRALDTLASSGRALGETLAAACALVDPEAIVLTGSATRSGDGWWEGLRAGFAAEALPPQRKTPLLRGRLGGAAPLLGAALAAAAEVTEHTDH